MKNNKKKNKIQKYYTGNYMFASCIYMFLWGIAMALLPIYLIYRMKQHQESIIPLGLIALALFVSGGMIIAGQAVFLTIMDPLLGRYSIDDCGITFYTWSKCIRYSWDEFADTGFTSWLTLDGNTYFIYFSKKKITYYYRKYIVKYRSFRKPKKPGMPLYLKDYALIQYSKTKFESLMEVVPDWMKEKLITEEKHIALKPVEKILNR